MSRLGTVARIGVAVAACTGTVFAHYHFLHYRSATGPFAPVPEKFDLRSLPNRTVHFFVSSRGPEREACWTGSRSGAGVTRFPGRKVRSPQGSVPANGRGDPLKADLTESATENIPPQAWQPARGKGEKVR